MVKTGYNHLSLEHTVKFHTEQAEDNPVCLEVWKEGLHKPEFHSLYEKDFADNSWHKVKLSPEVLAMKKWKE